LDIERKIQLPLNTPASPTDAKENIDVSMTDADDTKVDTDAASGGEEETSTANRKLRHTKKNKRKRETAEEKKEKAKKAKAEAAKTKQQQEWEKLLAAIEKKKDEIKDCEANVAELDDDLRETLVHRSKVIGKDRFLNKYYWFEHNGMPFGGVPTSSTAEYGYANGRLWVQGPDEYELQPNLEEPALSQDMQEFGFTIVQRKEKEEGSTHLSKSHEWGYYDDPEDLDKLLAWLDDRGVREKALRKELTIFRDRIAEYMVKMREHLSEPEEKKAEAEDTAIRVSTRRKDYVDKEASKERCLSWTNSIMREDLGYNHAEEYEPPRTSKRKGVAKATNKGRSKK
jgi:alpha-1,3-glucosyltransferase